jgi:sulfopyruvate decarboxylase subunit alpha
MDSECIRIVTESLKEQKVDLVLTVPEEPTHELFEAIKNDPYFTAITVAGEGHGVAVCAGYSVGGRDCVFITGIAGLLVGTWALSQIGILYGIPLLILASYRGDLGDRTGISGPQLQLFRQIAEPLLNALRIPYWIAGDKQNLKRQIRDAYFASQQYDSPVVLLLSGDVLW